MAADAGQLSWKCYDCNMTFGNPTLLQKHKARFCVGGQLGDPELLLLHRGLRSEDPPDPHPLPEDGDPPRYNPRQDPKIQQLAESHGRQMEFLHNRNRELERQREEIRRRLEELGRRPAKEDHSTEQLLRELREQEARNQRLLDELKQQLLEARRPVNIVRTEPDRQTKSYVYPIYYGNSLVAEIVAVRQAYLQNGGSDPDILSQLAQMQAEAQAIDDSMKNAQKKSKDRKDGVPPNILTLELENERLQRQLLLLQEQKLISTNRRKDNREGMPAQPVPKAPQKAPATQQTLSKWVQTNPVPSIDACNSALPPAKDYDSRRRQAKRDLDERWGEGEVTATANQPSKGKGGGKNAGRLEHSSDQAQLQEQQSQPGQSTQNSPRKLESVRSLRPERRLQTIEEAADDEEYDPDQPLDINLAVLSSRQNRVLYPYKPNVGSVVVKSEKPYGRVDFYGRELNRDGSLLQESEIRVKKPQPPQVSLRPKEDRFPYYKTHLAGQRLGFYEHLLRELFQRSEGLIFDDPYYYSLYRSRKRHTTEEDEVQSSYSPRKPKNPPLALDEVNDSEGHQEKDEDRSKENYNRPQKGNASTQTNREELALTQPFDRPDEFQNPQPGTSTEQNPRQKNGAQNAQTQPREPQTSDQKRQLNKKVPEQNTAQTSQTAPNTGQRYRTVAEVYGSDT